MIFISEFSLSSVKSKFCGAREDSNHLLLRCKALESTLELAKLYIATANVRTRYFTHIVSGQIMFLLFC